MNPTLAATADAVEEQWGIRGNLAARVHETHTGVVVLLGDKAYKAKKPLTTEFLDFSTVARRQQACEREVALNSRLSPDSYLGVGSFVGPRGGGAEPVIVMQRYEDSVRLASMVEDGRPVDDQLVAIARRLAQFHRDATRNEEIDRCGSADAVLGRWEQNLAELEHNGSVSRATIDELRRLASIFIAGRSLLLGNRISERRIVDGHADLLADDIFCPGGELAILDCLEFDDQLRYVDAIDDAAFLAMDLEFLGREDLGRFFLDEYCRLSGDTAPQSLKDFYIAYRALVRAKVDCVRVTQGHDDAVADADRHFEIARNHLMSATVQLIVVGGGPGTGKTTLSRALAKQLGAQVISTDDVRRELRQAGAVSGSAGVLNAGLYSPENVALVYDEILRRAQPLLSCGSSVILDGTWRDSNQRERAHILSRQTSSPIVELTCAIPLADASARIQGRRDTTSDATPQIAAAIAGLDSDRCDAGHLLDTSRPLEKSVADALRICRMAQLAEGGGEAKCQTS